MITTPSDEARRGGRRRWADESGRASWRGLVALVLFAALVYGAVKLIPVRTAAYQFSDAIRDQVTFAGNRRATDQQIREQLLDTAAELGLPVHAQDISIRRPNTKYLIIEANYTVPVRFIGGYIFNWAFSQRYEAPLIF